MSNEFEKTLEQFRETISREALLPRNWSGQKDKVTFRISSE
jgi:hypothetical protein